MMQVPCKDCKERKINCHSICGKYKEFNKEQEKVRQARAKLHDEIDLSKDSVSRCKRTR